MTDLIQEARELCDNARPGPYKVINDNDETEYLPFYVINDETMEDGEWFAELHVGDYATACLFARSRTLVDELADALEKAEAENEKLSVHGGKYMEIAQKRYEMYEAATARAEKAEAELAAYKEANPPRVHGEWIRYITDRYDNPSDAYKCSVCGLDDGYGPEENFCQACGADMRKEKPSERI